jgi:hypothetical protein
LDRHDWASTFSAELPVQLAAVDGCSWWQRTFGTIAAIDRSEPEADKAWSHIASFI